MSFLQLAHCDFSINSELLFSNLSWTWNRGEQWLITGPSGAGKTLFFQAMTGKFRLTGGQFSFEGFKDHNAFLALKKKSALVYFKDNEMNAGRFYYQQRYNSQDADDTIMVQDFLFDRKPVNNSSYQEIMNTFHTDIPLDKELIKLSNGENRKILIAKALLQNPEILILDNPYTGLDEPSRKDLNGMVDRLAHTGMHILLCSKQNTIPSSITHHLHLENRQIHYAGKLMPSGVSQPIKSNPALNIKFPPPEFNDYKNAVQFKQVTIRYEEKILLNKVNLTIRRGESWVLRGPNGAGKSLLSSLIYADHPQSYSNDITLFDRARGRGESIWEIKEKIGFLSPEFHFYFDYDQTAREVVLGCLKDHPYKIKPLTDSMNQLLHDLFQYYQITSLLDQPMYILSTGIQRLILFIRVLIKNPAFLLLDEPFQHFDQEMIWRSKILLNEFCQDRTMLFITHEEAEIPEGIKLRANIDKGVLSIG